ALVRMICVILNPERPDSNVYSFCTAKYLSSKLRRSCGGDDTVKRMSHYHAVQFYKDDYSLAATAAGFLADGIDTGHPALVVATPAHTARILAAMKDRGLDVDTLRRT